MVSDSDEAISFPTEIVASIIFYHRNDKGALRNDCLVSRTWRDAAQPHLLSVARISNLNDITKWKDRFSSSPHILHLIRVVVIDSGREPFIWVGSNRYNQRCVLDLSPEDLQELPMMPKVELLEWAPHHMWYPQMSPTIIELFTKFPTLDGISLNAKFFNIAQLKIFLSFGGFFKRLEFRHNFALNDPGTCPVEERYFDRCALEVFCDVSAVKELTIFKPDASATRHNSFDWLVNDIFSEEFPMLRSIDIQGVNILSVDAFAQLIRLTMPSLRYLAVQPSSISSIDRVNHRSPPLRADILYSLVSLVIGPIKIDSEDVQPLDKATSVLQMLPAMPFLHTVDLMFQVTDFNHLSQLLEEEDQRDNTVSETSVGNPAVTSLLRFCFLIRNAERDVDRTALLEAKIWEILRAPWLEKHLEILWEYPTENSEPEDTYADGENKLEPDLNFFF